MMWTIMNGTYNHMDAVIITVADDEPFDDALFTRKIKRQKYHRSLENLFITSKQGISTLLLFLGVQLNGKATC